MDNYTDEAVPYTRIIEHKPLEYAETVQTVISREYPGEWRSGAEPYYPVNNDRNNALYDEYSRLAQAQSKVYFGGRLAQYKYYDMDKVIAAALELSEQILN